MMRCAEGEGKIIELKEVVEEIQQPNEYVESAFKEKGEPGKDKTSPEALERLEEDSELWLEGVAKLDTESVEKIVREVARQVMEGVATRITPDVIEALVKAMDKGIQRIALELFPSIAERMIREEIRRLKEGEDGSHHEP